MRILVTGATGLIGSAVLARLRRDGHETVAAVRPSRDRAPPPGQKVAADLAHTDVDTWRSHLAGIDVVVNCAGIFQDSPKESTAAVHSEGAARLFSACEAAGVKNVVQVSAMGVERDAPTAFARSKYAGDEALMATALDWVVLRPSVVVGRAAYGGSALFRGLAALPVLPLPADAGPLQVVQLEDLVETIAVLVRPEAPSRVVLEVAGPEALSFHEVIAAYRRWLGWPRQRVFKVPDWSMRLLSRVGDCLGVLGWRVPLRTTGRLELLRGAVGDTRAWEAATGIRPVSLSAALAAEPASVQERWFARVYLLKPLVLGVLALYWIVTGLVALGPGWASGIAVMRDGGLGTLAPVAVAAGALADIAIGAGIAVRRTTRLALVAALVLSLVYVAMGTLLVPALWIDPLGPLVKIAPILVLHLVALATVGDR